MTYEELLTRSVLTDMRLGLGAAMTQSGSGGPVSDDVGDDSAALACADDGLAGQQVRDTGRHRRMLSLASNFSKELLEARLVLVLRERHR